MTDLDVREAMNAVAAEASEPPADLLGRVEAGRRRHRRNQAVAAAFAAVVVLAAGSWAAMRPTAGPARTLPRAAPPVTSVVGLHRSAAGTEPAADHGHVAGRAGGSPRSRRPPRPARRSVVLDRLDDRHLLMSEDCAEALCLRPRGPDVPGARRRHRLVGAQRTRAGWPGRHTGSCGSRAGQYPATELLGLPGAGHRRRTRTRRRRAGWAGRAEPVRHRRIRLLETPRRRRRDPDVDDGRNLRPAPRLRRLPDRRHGVGTAAGQVPQSGHRRGPPGHPTRPIRRSDASACPPSAWCAPRTAGSCSGWTAATGPRCPGPDAYDLAGGLVLLPDKSLLDPLTGKRGTAEPGRDCRTPRQFGSIHDQVYYRWGCAARQVVYLTPDD